MHMSIPLLPLLLGTSSWRCSASSRALSGYGSRRINSRQGCAPRPSLSWTQTAAECVDAFGLAEAPLALALAPLALAP